MRAREAGLKSGGRRVPRLSEHSAEESANGRADKHAEAAPLVMHLDRRRWRRWWRRCGMVVTRVMVRVMSRFRRVVMLRRRMMRRGLLVNGRFLRRMPAVAVWRGEGRSAKSQARKARNHQCREVLVHKIGRAHV